MSYNYATQGFVLFLCTISGLLFLRIITFVTLSSKTLYGPLNNCSILLPVSFLTITSHPYCIKEVYNFGRNEFFLQFYSVLNFVEHPYALFVTYTLILKHTFQYYIMVQNNLLIY